MKKIYYLLRITFITKFAYIKAFWFNLFGTIVSILIYYFLWKSVFLSRNELKGFTMAEMTTYVILSRILSSQFSGGINRELSEWIYKGNIIIELLRPINLITTLLSKRIGEFLFFLIFKGVPAGALGIFILNGVLPLDPIKFILFFLSIIISIGILFWIEVMVGLISLFTLNSYGVSSTKNALLSILSGGVIPLFLFPEKISVFLNYLPFAGMVSIPINIYLGKYNLIQSLKYIGLQVIWAFLLGILTVILYNSVIKKVVVQGG
ncbi:ABC-2 family transporter protein [Lacrimispora sp. BS-2]|uniref:ABC-2 family transporter protein n=1 Tax=Lacrimispora sp. BS-2 TaxID=3151850 RepID=A0AAU7PKF6_9FIRM